MITNRYTDSALRAELYADWRDKAACKGQGALMGDPARVPEARQLCWSCPVRGDCMAWVFGLQQREDPRGDVVAALTYSQRRGRRLSAAYYQRLEASQ